jgi:hypothetical protein
MKKKILSMVCLVSVILFASAGKTSAQAFNTGDNVLSLGIGLGSSLGGSYGYSSQTPGISLQFEHGQWDVGGPGCISLGGYLGFKSFSYDGGFSYPYAYTYTQKWNYTVIGIRSAYHYNGINSKDWDVYGGAMLSYDILTYKYTSSDPTYDYLYNHSYNGGVGFTLYIGGRYFFSDNVAAFAELGYGISYFTIGGAFKF